MSSRRILPLCAAALAAAVVAVPASADADAIDPSDLEIAPIHAPAGGVVLQPGQTRWQEYEASLVGRDTADLALALQTDGALAEIPEGLRIGVDTCTEAWSWPDAGAPTCAAGAVHVLTASPADAGEASPAFVVDDLAAGAPRRILLTLALPAALEGASVAGLEGEFALRLTASGADIAGPVPSPDPTLPPTDATGDADPVEPSPDPDQPPGSVAPTPVSSETPAPPIARPSGEEPLAITGLDLEQQLAALAGAGIALAAGAMLMAIRRRSAGRDTR